MPPPDIEARKQRIEQSVGHLPSLTRAALKLFSMSADDDDYPTRLGQLLESEPLRGFELDLQTDQAIARGLAAREVPSLAVWAAADPALGSQRRHLARLLPNCPLQILADARHFLMLDYAVEIAEALALAGIERW